MTRRNRQCFKKALSQKVAKSNHLSATQLASKNFKDAIRKSCPKSRRVFLDLFAGHEGVSSALHRQGFGCVSFDVESDARLDLTDPAIIQLIEGWIRSGCIRGIWLATPCTTWSRARRGPRGSGWGPLRDNHFIFGFPELSGAQREKVRVGNATMRATARIIRCAVACRVPVFLENPNNSMIWQAPPIKRLIHLRSSKCYITDFCQHGARWRKRTKVFGWFSQESPQLQKVCAGHGGRCSKSGKFHIVLSGSDPVSKQLWTHLAQPYPAKFAEAAAAAMIDASNVIEDYSFRLRFGC